MNEILDTHLQELRRGTIVLACLQLLRTAGYGYGLLEELERRGFATDANTLYPLLRRLEKQEYLTSEWNTDEARPRKFYRTSDAGIAPRRHPHRRMAVAHDGDRISHSRGELR